MSLLLAITRCIRNDLEIRLLKVTANLISWASGITLISTWLTHRTSDLEKAAPQEPRRSCFWSPVTFCPLSSRLASPASCPAPDITPTVQSRETSEGQTESGWQEGRAGEVPTCWEALALRCSGASVCPESCAPWRPELETLPSYQVICSLSRKLPWQRCWLTTHRGKPGPSHSHSWWRRKLWGAESLFHVEVKNIMRLGCKQALCI